MTYNADYFPTMAVIGILLLGLFILDRVYCKKRTPAIEGAPLKKKYPGAVELGIFFVCLTVFYCLNSHDFVFYNNYSYLADAFLHGRLYVDGMPAYLESIEFGGHVYMHFAPGPALLCIPFVALFGVEGFNIAYLSILLGAGNGVLFYKVFERLGIGRDLRERLWCAAFAIFGTVHCFLAAIGHGWFLGHVSSWFFLLLGMVFLTAKKKPYLNMFFAGFFYALAVTCRMPNLLGAVFYFGYILLRVEKGKRLKSLLLFCCGAAIPGGLYMLYNYARFGSIMDKGYNLTHLKDYFRDRYDAMQALPKEQQLAYLKAAEKEVGGPLQIQFVKYNLYSIFCLMPELSSSYPYLIPTLAGVSLTAISPALYFLVRADYRDRLTWFLAGATVVCAIPFLLNYGNGYAQFGMRYAMDFLPYMIILGAMGLTRRPLNGWKTALLLLCIFLNLWGPVFWNCFYLA